MSTSIIIHYSGIIPIDKPLLTIADTVKGAIQSLFSKNVLQGDFWTE